MKSAYELAMERLRAEEPDTQTLTDAQKSELEAIHQRYKAKIAEREVFLQGQLTKAAAARRRDEVQQLERQLRDERIRLEEEREAEKDRVRAR